MRKSKARGSFCRSVKCQEPVAFRLCQAEGHRCPEVWVMGSHRTLLSRSESGQRLLSWDVLEELRWPCVSLRGLDLCRGHQGTLLGRVG